MIPDRPEVAQWLALHALDGPQLGAWMDRAACLQNVWSKPDAPLGRSQPPPTADAAWAICVEACCALFADPLATKARQVAQQIRCLSQTPPRGALGATLPHPTTGQPVVLCPYTPTPKMWMILAHECGHALHLGLGPRDPVPPPILRETCASLAEIALISWLGDTGRFADQAACAELWAHKLEQAKTTGRARLNAALATPDAPFDYALNYPPARLLAAQICGPQHCDLRAELFVSSRDCARFWEQVEFHT